MRVGIDCRFAPTPTGLGRYTRSMVRALLQRNDDVEYTLFVRSVDEGWLHDLPSVTTIVAAPFRHYSFAEQVCFPSVIRKSGIDLLFAPHFNVPLTCPVPFVVTIHDLILHRYPNEASRFKQWAYRRVLCNAVRRARHVITVSNFTLRELTDVFGDEIGARATRIYEGIGDSFKPASKEEQQRVRDWYGLEKPFFLYVGNAKEHKNVQMLIDAYVALGDRSRELVIVTSGREHWDMRLSPGAVRITNVVERDLPALYSAAIAFITASLYEGFCLPAIEAEACGCRVIASNRGAIPEVIGPTARLIEPTVGAIVSAMCSVDSMEPPQPKDFSWKKAAETTAAVLRQVL